MRKNLNMDLKSKGTKINIQFMRQILCNAPNLLIGQQVLG